MAYYIFLGIVFIILGVASAAGKKLLITCVCEFTIIVGLLYMLFKTHANVMDALYWSSFYAIIAVFITILSGIIFYILRKILKHYHINL